MYILYVDDSGSVTDTAQRHFVLGGICVFERSISYLIKEVETCIASFNLGDIDDIELHGTDIYGGRNKPWSSVKTRSIREKYLIDTIDVIAKQNKSVYLFAIAIDKISVSPRDAIEVAFEELCNRFNLFLQRQNNRNKYQQRGLIVMDESHHERPLQRLAKNFSINGSRWGVFKNIAEVPLFVDSKATRLIQLADIIAWSTFRKYEYADGRFFDPLMPKFDADGGVIHGLYHYRSNANSTACYCPAYMSRERPNKISPMLK